MNAKEAVLKGAISYFQKTWIFEKIQSNWTLLLNIEFDFILYFIFYISYFILYFILSFYITWTICYIKTIHKC